ncbi:MAG TPA: DUF3131 domain-containing protein [Longimicrobiaceae bacterium]|nr:DUF3131 domain-containing protein [Longimicrobiaceae bacterium]
MRSWLVRNPILSASTLAVGIAAWFVFSPRGVRPAASTDTPPVLLRAAVPDQRLAFQPDSIPDERRVLLEAANAAWVYVNREYQPATGLVNSVAGYPYATVWDIASGLAALYCANRLGLLEDTEYDRRMRLALRTLRNMRLFDGAAFNKNYSTRTGAIAGRDDRDRKVAARGYGWSALDIGRLLVWLRIIRSTQPHYAGEIDAIVERLDFSRLVKDGYIWGETVGRRGRTQRYPEGRIPYEQYAAAGFGLWGHRAEKALSLSENAIPITVMDVPLIADRRGHDHLTSEPFVLAGLELGWTPEMRDLALRMLAVQRERYTRTGQVTVVSEDALPQAPYYFYYYTVNLHGKWFAVSAQDPNARLEGPRWVSSKAAFGWYALVPSDYTRLAVETVAPARHAARGWSSGVYEGTGQPTRGENVNTAAVILEAALYRTTRRPLVEGSAEGTPLPVRVPSDSAPAASTQSDTAVRRPG